MKSRRIFDFRRDKQGSECNRYSENRLYKIKDYFELDAQVRKITIELQKKGWIAEINVFSGHFCRIPCRDRKIR
ncbi:MAG: hypothetical protein ACLUFF_06560 [Acutalibacteraceae bacterium]